MIPSEYFEPLEHESSDFVDGVDRELLEDLYDCVWHYGNTVAEGTMRVLAFEPEPPDEDEIHVGIVIVDGNMNMKISRYARALVMGRCRAFLLSDPVPSACVWDTDIIADDMRMALGLKDLEMEASGHFDPVTKKRSRITDVDQSSEVIKVDEFFKQPNAILIVPEGETYESMMARFDKPEDVLPLEMAIGNRKMIAFCHRRDHAIVMRSIATQMAMEKRGITDPSNLVKLSEEEYAEFQQEILIITMTLLADSIMDDDDDPDLDDGDDSDDDDDPNDDEWDGLDDE